MSETTADYRAEMDVIGDFLAECCVLDPRAEVQSRRLYACYEAWCEGSGERPLSSRRLAPHLRRYKLRDRHARVGTVWQGVRLRGEEEGMTEEDLEPGSWG